MAPVFTVCAGNAGRTPIFQLFCCGAKVSPGSCRPVTCAVTSPSPYPSSARTGINRVVRAPGGSCTGCGCPPSSDSLPVAVRETFSVCGWSVRLVRSSVRREVSPLARKRGVLSSVITGAATTTLLSLLPKSSSVQACAIRRSSPLKSPIGSVIVPSPLASSVTGCACWAMMVTWFTGGLPPRFSSSPSPPKRSAARRPCPSMTWPYIS